MAKDYHSVSFFLLLAKIFELFLNNRLVDHLKKFDLFLISSMISSSLVQLLIFRELYLTDLLRLS